MPIMTRLGLCVATLLFGSPGKAAQKQASPEIAITTAGRDFFGEPVHSRQQLFEGRGARDIVTTKTGSVLAFHDHTLRESPDGGTTWGPAREIGRDAGGKIVLDETNGDLLFVRADKGFLWREPRRWPHVDSRPIRISAESIQARLSRYGPVRSRSAFQPGVTLQFGRHKGRLLVPGASSGRPVRMT
jgi:hypothetical protein